MTLKIAVLIYDGFDELDALGPYEVLKNAALAGADARVNLVTVEPATSATGNHGVSVAAHGFLRDGVDVLIVPGGTWEELNEPGARAVFERGALPQRVAALHARGTT